MLIPVLILTSCFMSIWRVLCHLHPGCPSAFSVEVLARHFRLPCSSHCLQVVTVNIWAWHCKLAEAVELRTYIPRLPVRILIRTPSILRYIIIVRSSSKNIPGEYLKMGGDSFLPNSFTYHPASRRCVVWAANKDFIIHKLNNLLTLFGKNVHISFYSW